MFSVCALLKKNDCLNFYLLQLCATTTVAAGNHFQEDCLWLNGRYSPVMIQNKQDSVQHKTLLGIGLITSEIKRMSLSRFPGPLTKRLIWRATWFPTPKLKHTVVIHTSIYTKSLKGPFSFFPRTINEWNSLLKEIVTLNSVDAFKVSTIILHLILWF